jgi:hypothetical protein
MEAQPFAHWMQEDMIAQLDRTRPKYLVLVSVDTSWTRREDSSMALIEWADRTVRADYTAVGRVDVFRDRPSAFHWGDAAARPLASRAFVSVYERRPM